MLSGSQELHVDFWLHEGSMPLSPTFFMGRLYFHLLPLVFHATLLIHFTSTYFMKCTLIFKYFYFRQLPFKEIEIKKNIWHIYPHFSFSHALSFYFASDSFELKNFLKEHPLTVLVVQVCWWLILSAFVCLEKSSFYLYFFLNGIFTGYRIMTWPIFFSFKF